MDCYYLIPHLVLHVGKGLVSQDTSIIHQYIDTAISVYRSFHSCIPILSGSLITHGFSPILLDFLDNIVGINQIVDNHGGAGFCKEKGI